MKKGLKPQPRTGREGRGGLHVREAAAAYHAVRLDAARRALPSDAQVADVLGVDRSQITRWREGRTVPEAEAANRLAGLDVVVELLTGYLEPESILKWLRGVNAHLDNRRPVDVIREGNLSDVIAAIEALKSGAYA